jgi:hypothetical protein
VRLEPEEHAVLLTFHHLVLDEVSVTVFTRELSELYRARLEGRSPRLPELPFQFVDYTLHERARLQGENLERLEAFWRRELRDTPTLDLPTDRPRPPELTFAGDWVERRAPRDIFDAVARLAREARVTPYVVLLAATAALVHRLSDQDDFILGAPSENRTLARSELLVGCFLNVLPLRIDCSGAPTMLEFLERMRDTLLRAYDHQELPISRIVDAVRPPREPNRLPLVQVSCELQLGDWLPLELPGCTVDYRLVAHGTARYELAFHGIVKDDHLLLALELNTDLWDLATGARLLAELEGVLRAMTAAPALRLSEAAAGATPEAEVQ